MQIPPHRCHYRHCVRSPLCTYLPVRCQKEKVPLTVDHSIPGVAGFIIHTSKGTIAYTADLRYHGRRKSDTEGFVERCGRSDLDYLLCEGTRIHETYSKTEYEVEGDVNKIVERTKKLVVCSYPTRDLDRLLSFLQRCA